MDSTVLYVYSKKNSYVTIVVLLILGLLFTSNIIKSFNNNDHIDAGVFIVFLVILIIVLGIVINKRLRPAIGGQLALEFNDKGIVDYIRNVTIDWQDIESVNLKRTRSSAMLWLKLKWESDYGSQIFISLRWVEGKDRDIYNTALAFFNKAGFLNA